MVDIRPNALPDAILPLRTGDELIVDQGADGVRKVDPFALTDSTAPVATQTEAQVGADNAKRMTPLRTKQSIASEIGVTLASNSQGAKADSAVQSVNGKTGNSVTIVKGDIGLGNVDNTSDINKPISTATQTALDGKASSAQGAKADSAVQSVNGKTGNTITITKADVGLGNVDNTSDANKPISTATQAALDLKANSSVTISAGAGLTGGGNLTANRAVSLNAASIASLAKADSSVQTVNGVAPTGGNVTVAAEEKRLQDTRTTAMAESFGSNVLFVETAGYSSVGDGGGALYKRVSSEPTHAGKFQSADGAWWGFAENRPNVKMFGAVGDGVSDDTDAINDALEAAFIQKKTLYFPSGTYLVRESDNAKRCLYNRGVSMVGDGANNTFIAPYGNVATDVDFILVAPAATNFNDFLRITDLSIWPAYPNFDTSVKGKRAIWIVTNTADINTAKFLISRCYFFPSNDWSIHFENNPSLLPQGCPSNSLISDNAIWGGVNMSFSGDSNVIERNIIRSPVSLRPGIQFLTVVGSFGSAGHNVIRDNNIDCPGGALYLRAGRHFIIDSNNIEHSAGSGTAMGAVVDLSGDIQTLEMPVVSNNVIAAFGTSSAMRSLRIGNCTKTEVVGNKMDSDSPRGQAVWITVSAASTLFGFNDLTNAWAAKVTDEGTGTRSYTIAPGYTPS